MKISHPRSGFTLIELLTVIAIIGVLAAIIIPVVGKVKSSAKNSTCTSNLRQLAVATLLFEQDKKFFPPAQATTSFNTHTAVANDGSIWTALLAPYLNAGRDNAGDVRECPVYRDSDQTIAVTATNIAYRAGYALNRRPLLPFTDVPDPRAAIEKLKRNSIPSPAKTVLLLESSDWHCNGYNAGGLPANWVGDRHGSSSNYAFMDGSVRSLGRVDALRLLMLPGTAPTS